MKWRSMQTQSYINVINAPGLSTLLRAFRYTVAEYTKTIHRIVTGTNSARPARPDTDKLMRWILGKELRVVLERVTVHQNYLAHQFHPRGPQTSLLSSQTLSLPLLLYIQVQEMPCGLVLKEVMVRWTGDLSHILILFLFLILPLLIKPLMKI